MPKADGYKTVVFDHLTKEQLREKYKGHSANINLIEDVDILGSTLADVHGTFDCIVGAHLIEHTPDMIGFLKDCSRLMHDGSSLYLIVPDKRHVFDALRPLTSTGNVIDAHLLGRTRHVGALFDTKINASSRGKRNLWGPREEAPIDHIHNFAEAKKLVSNALNSTKYVDTHAWCFTPESFRLIMFDLGALGLIDLVEERFHTNNGSEFYFVMRKGKIDEQVASQERAALAIEALEVERAFNRSLATTQINFRQ
ncbi:hypothetical protein [Rhizobium lusitanum]|uniref:hypothetical protein n=1 Tax=Rhizobium lusitanum TaxID=293958 RepID=UPI0025728E52|nr:hypothetical protein [Rhizobium lusitanum]